VSFFSLPKEKERGNKGRAIYRAVGSQVTYATHIAPAAYALRVTLFTTSTCIDNYFSYLYLSITLYCFKGVINREIYLRCLPIYIFTRA